MLCGSWGSGVLMIGLVAEVLHVWGIHYGEVEGLVSVERWSCSRGASCVVEYTMGKLRDWPL